MLGIIIFTIVTTSFFVLRLYSNKKILQYKKIMRNREKKIQLLDAIEEDIKTL